MIRLSTLLHSKNEVYFGSTEPSDRNVIWVDTANTPYVSKVFNVRVQEWEVNGGGDGTTIIDGSDFNSILKPSVITFELLPLDGNSLYDIRLVEDVHELYYCGDTTAGSVDNMQLRLSNKFHDHNGQYYTKTMMNSLLSQKSSSTHTHQASVITLQAINNPNTVIYGRNLQTAIAELDLAKETAHNKGQPLGYAELNSYGMIPLYRLPGLNLTRQPFVVDSEEEQLSCGARPGEMVIRTDEVKTYVHNGGVTGTMLDYTQLQIPNGMVLSVNGQTGIVVLDASDISCIQFIEGDYTVNNLEEGMAALYANKVNVDTFNAHNHTGLYALLDHNHDNIYAAYIHNHDSSYYTKQETTQQIILTIQGYVADSHNHDTLYYRKGTIDTHFSDLTSGINGINQSLSEDYYTIAQLAEMYEIGYDPFHNHDDRYYTQGYLNSNFVHVDHSHNNLYYLKTETYDKSEIDAYFSGGVDPSHNHDNIYYRIADLYTKTEINTALNTTNGGFVNHDWFSQQLSAYSENIYNTNQSHLTNGHGELYYTRTQLNDATSGKAGILHTHDGRYYMKSEIDYLLANGLSIEAHRHNVYDIDSTDVFGDFTDATTLPEVLSSIISNMEMVGYKGQPLGYCELDQSGWVPIFRVNPRLIVNVLQASSESEQLGFQSQEGDWCIRNDTSQTFIHLSSDTSTMADWMEINVMGSIANKIGAAEILFTPTGNFDSTTVAAALAELGIEKADSTHNHSHGSLNGIGNDDHTQYFNSTRHGAADHTGFVTFEALETNGDIGTYPDQVARGDHTHSGMSGGDTSIVYVNSYANFGSWVEIAKHDYSNSAISLDLTGYDFNVDHQYRIMVEANNITGVSLGVRLNNRSDLTYFGVRHFGTSGNTSAADSAIGSTFGFMLAEPTAGHCYGEMFLSTKSGKYRQTNLVLNRFDSTGDFYTMSEAGTQPDSTSTITSLKILSSASIPGTASIRVLQWKSQTLVNNWLTSIANSNCNANPSDEIFTDTSAGTFTITLPANPSFGMRVVIIDAAGTWDINPVFVSSNSKKINGAVDDLVLNVKDGKVELRYFNETRGQIII